MGIDGEQSGDGGKSADEPAAPAIGVDPIGQALRATYDAENHDTLGRDLTGLMLALARVDVPPLPSLSPPIAGPVASAGAAPIDAPAAPRSWRQRLFGR